MGKRRLLVRARPTSLSWARWILSALSRAPSVISTLISSSHLRLGLPSVFFRPTVWSPFLSSARARLTSGLWLEGTRLRWTWRLQEVVRADVTKQFVCDARTSIAFPRKKGVFGSGRTFWTNGLFHSPRFRFGAPLWMEKFGCDQKCKWEGRFAELSLRWNFIFGVKKILRFGKRFQTLLCRVSQFESLTRCAVCDLAGGMFDS